MCVYSFILIHLHNFFYFILLFMHSTDFLLPQEVELRQLKQTLKQSINVRTHRFCSIPRQTEQEHWRKGHISWYYCYLSRELKCQYARKFSWHLRQDGGGYDLYFDSTETETRSHGICMGE
jgi:hypothetical protein